MAINPEQYHDLSSILSPEWDFDPFNSRQRQQAYEARVAASVIQILRDKRGRKQERTNIYLNGLFEQAPDVLVIYFDKAGNQIRELPIEVVTFNEHSAQEGIIRFFHRTKLSKEFAYQQNTAIVCHIDLFMEDPSRTGRQVSGHLNSLGREVVRHPFFLYNEGNVSRPYLARVYPGFEEYTCSNNIQIASD